MPPEFRQRRYFYYLTGAEDADCYVTYDIRSDRLTLWVPPQRTDRQILYMGPVVTPSDAMHKYAIDKAQYAKDLDLYVDSYLKTGYTIYLLHRGDYPAIANSTPGYDGSPPSLDFGSLKRAMDACRVIKDDWEISALREANRITSLAHIEVLKNITKLKNESGVEGVYIGTCIAAGAKTQAYNPICGAGENAATLHYIENSSSLNDQQLLLIDAGAEYKCYASDVTRTFPVSPSDLGYPSPEAENIYKLVEQMQEACIQRVNPGVLFRDLNILAHYVAVKGLLELEVLHNGTVEEIIKAGTSAAFFPHGLGHHVGLEVHDVEDPDQPILQDANRYKRLTLQDVVAQGHVCPFGLRRASQGNDIDLEAQFSTSFHSYFRIREDEFDWDFGHLIADKDSHTPLCRASTGLRAGMVVTIEPGIYFNKFGLEKIYLKDPVHQKYINVGVLNKYMSVGGVRIEDDILVSLLYIPPLGYLSYNQQVTEDGYENLTITPKGDEAIKIIRQYAIPKPTLPAITRLPIDPFY
jgi:Xaa-Pro dipeptidase